VENETRFSRKYQCESREAHESRKKRKMRYIVKLAILAICESCNLQDLQTSKIIIHSDKLVFDQNSRKTPEIKLVMISRESRYKISVCETRESHYEICLRGAILAMKFLSVNLIRSNSRYDFRSKTCFSRVLLQNFCLRDSREASFATNFDSRVSRESR
jgi:hypothetical protein